jgi:hypothetical protein
MSVANSSAVYRSMLRAKKRGQILKNLPENVQQEWVRFRELSLPIYHISKFEKIIIWIFATPIILKLFLKGKKIRYKKIYSIFLASIKENNKKFEESSLKPEIQTVLKSFKAHGVEWNNYGASKILA